MVTRFLVFLWLLWLGLVYEVIFDNYSRLGKALENNHNFEAGIFFVCICFAMLLFLTFIIGPSDNPTAPTQEKNNHKDA